MNRFPILIALFLVGCGGGGGGGGGAAGPAQGVLDLRTVDTLTNLLRLHGSQGTGMTGVPVCGGFDCDGDGNPDVAMASFRASPLGRPEAGQVYLLFGDGTVKGTFDTAVDQAAILRILGAEDLEIAGSEIWMDDVTGDGLGDLLIARQNHTFGGTRDGAGALTVVVGGAALATHALTLDPLDLAAPPPGITVLTLIGAAAGDRLGIWVRTGDVDGDTVADILIGADQESGGGDVHRGGVWLIHGGPHLAANIDVDLAGFGGTVLAGRIVHVTPPPGSGEIHFGATCQLADLDGNGFCEVIAGAAIDRAGGALQPAGGGVAHGVAGTADGTLFILWDENFPPAPWPVGLEIEFTSSPGARTTIRGGARNVQFGEEILGGLDYDGNGQPDLYVGDITGDGSTSQTKPKSGMSHVLFDAVTLKGLDFGLDAPPPGLRMSTFIGATAGEIAGDTACHGDFNGDGIDDLAFSSPHAAALGRAEAGVLHVIFGRAGGWPESIDLAALPGPEVMSILQVMGGHGSVSGDVGDVLCYSAAAADIDNDGRTDIITNEMMGNGVAAGVTDVGNLIVISGKLLEPPVAQP